MTQRESVGGIQVRMAEVRDLGVNLGCDGAEGASKVRTPYMVILLSQINMFMHTWKRFVSLPFRYIIAEMLHVYSTLHCECICITMQYTDAT